MKAKPCTSHRSSAGADEIPPAALVEIAVGVVMQCLALRPADAQSYLPGRARSEARTVMTWSVTLFSVGDHESAVRLALLRSWGQPLTTSSRLAPPRAAIRLPPDSRSCSAETNWADRSP
jgi:hypothetical protein